MFKATEHDRPEIHRLVCFDGSRDRYLFGIPAGSWEVETGDVVIAVVSTTGNIVTILDRRDWRYRQQLGAIYPSPCAIPEELGMPADTRQRIVDIAASWGIDWSSGCSRSARTTTALGA